MSQPHSQIAQSNLPHTNVPIAVTSFIGRERETADIKRLLASSQLVTLTGAAGCGKTRLALREANDVSRDYADGVYWVELASLSDPAFVPQAVAKALNVAAQPGRALSDALVDYLHDKQLLLVLDNCEHLLNACAQLVENSLRAPDLRILTTSREPLAIAGETLYPVSPLSLPPADLRNVDLKQHDAIRLFVERARAILPHFALTQENTETVVRICRRLDGIPLAIELASARVNLLTVEQIDSRLDNRFALLASPSRVTTSHHLTLRAAIDWSYDLLSAPEQALLRRLAVFAAGWTLDAAEAVCADDTIAQTQILVLLASLVNKSLVVAETLAHTQARYRLLETIREYAQEKLDESNEAVHLRDRHLKHLVRQAEVTVPKLHGEYQRLWFNWMETEHDNFRAALAWSLESHQIEAGMRLAVALHEFWLPRGYLPEGRIWFERLIPQVSDEIPIVLRAWATAYYGQFLAFLGNPGFQRWIGEAFDLSAAAGEAGKPAMAAVLMGMAGSARYGGDYEAAYRYNERSTQIHRELGDQGGIARSLFAQSQTAMSIGNYATARTLLDESASLSRELHDIYLLSQALNYLGDVARCEKDYVRAQAMYEQSLENMKELGAMRDMAGTLHNLAHAFLHQGNVERAREFFEESLSIHRTQANVQGIAECLRGFAAMAFVRGQVLDAARLLAAVMALGGEDLLVLWPAERVEHEYYLAAVCDKLTSQEFESAEREGRALTLEQAIEYAQNVMRQSTTPETKTPMGGLTERERQVAALIARGKSNAEIADELVLSKRTVETHAANILSKLGFDHRAQIMHWAMENGLVKPK